ncbi:MAG: cob(I)yrinic acid a,c-diamide adenosyltransferase [Patescibacteria group bacterium]
MSIYTRSGDTGSTSLFGGKRVLKCEELVDVYGSIDELNSWVGLIAAEFSVPDVSQFLQTIQSDLFTIGSTLAGWKGDLTLLDGRIKEMETRIDMMEKDLPPIRNFILPGGAELAAHAHIMRSICRRVERQTVALSQKQEVDKRIVKYLNRLSDLFFMLARFINKQENVEEVEWSGKQ